MRNSSLPPQKRITRVHLSVIGARLPGNARGPINSAHFLMAVRVKPNPLRRSVVSQSLNDIKHLIKHSKVLF